MKRKTRRFLSIVTLLALCLTLLPISALATGSTKTPAPAFLSSGTGTQSDPWQITSASDLADLAEFINGGYAADYDAGTSTSGGASAGEFSGYYFQQTADIDLSDYDNWEPIGYFGEEGNRYFAGNYDGNGYTISNLTSQGTMDDDGYASGGLFGWLAFGSVSNLTIDQANISVTGEGMTYVGGLAGVAYVAEITNVTVTNSTITSKREPIVNQNYAGGVVGMGMYATLEQCASVSNTVSSSVCAGGLIGTIQGDVDSTAANCYVATTTVSTDSGGEQIQTYSGCFMGVSQGGSLIATNCFVYNSKTQCADASGAQGLFAAQAEDGDVDATNCYYLLAKDTEYEHGVYGSAKTIAEFATGEVAALLNGATGTAWGQSIGTDLYPVFLTLDNTVYSVTDCQGDVLFSNTTDTGQHRYGTEWQHDTTDHWQVCSVCGEESAHESHVSEKGTPTSTATCSLCGTTFSVTSATQDATESPPAETADASPEPSDESPPTATPEETQEVTAETTEPPPEDTEEPAATDDPEPEPTSTAEPSDEPSAQAETTAEDYTTLVLPYTDVFESDYYYRPVQWATGLGFISGVSDTTFAPNDTCTRAEIINFLYSLAGRPEVDGTNPFNDVSEDSYYYDAVIWAVQNNITAGTSSTTFSPDDVCTRNQIITFLYAQAGQPQTTDTMPFTDVAESEYCFSSVSWAAANGVTAGTSDTTFSPSEQCIRAYAVTFLYANSKSNDNVNADQE